MCKSITFGCLSKLAVPYNFRPPAIPSGKIYSFNTDSGLEYEVRFARKKDNLLNCTIAFGVLNEEYEGEEYVVVNRGEMYRVMATIVAVIREYIDRHPNVRTYEYAGEPSSKETPDGPSKRMMLYDRYLETIFGPGWDFKRNGNKKIISKIV